ncbi:PilN domain-containing protein [Acidobacteria bacterium AH-259-O06]|nr:PilN domain-containing protein [Acidobacteria bacterium AH-259-O06]
MIRINLLPTLEAFEKIPIQIYAGLAVIALGSVVLGGWYWQSYTNITEKEQVESQLTQESLRLDAILVLVKVSEFEARKKSLQDRISAIDFLRENQKGPVELMNTVIASIPDNPPGLWLSSLVQRGNNISLEGRAFDVPFIADFIATLNDSPTFKFVELQFWEQEEAGNIRFQLNCQTEVETE